jgi:hypothetical protein
MAFFDLPLDQLKTYLPARDEPADFDSFWKSTLNEARTFPLNATFEKVDYGLVAQETFDVTFNGFGGQPIKGWFILPAQHVRAQRAVPLHVSLNSSATAADATSRLTGSFGQAQATPTSSWIHADRAARGQQATRPIYILRVVVHNSLAV